MNGNLKPLPGPYGEAQRRAIEMAETLIRDLEESGDVGLLREARAVLRDLRTPKPVRRAVKSEGALRQQQAEILQAVAVADATGELK